MKPESRERKGTATVLAQEEDRLTVEYEGERLTVPMRGFPPGFTVRPGKRVILVDEPPGTVARPLVRAITSRIAPRTLTRPGELEVEGRRMELQRSTVLEGIPVRPEERPAEPEEYVLWVMEPREPERSDQVVAARRRR